MTLAATALALFWQWIFAPVVIAVWPIISRQLFLSDVLMLPIRTAASIPFGVLALLGLMMREVVQQKKSAVEESTSD